MITASNLCFLRRGRPVIEEVSTVIEPGRVTVAIGPNGAGKSTLLKLLSGELVPATGRIDWAGRPLATIPLAELARRRAVLPQGGAPVFPMTVHELVRLGARASGARDLDAVVDEALAQADLTGWNERSFDRLSGGERQRVHFARALAQVPRPVTAEGPAALFLDEPTAALDLSRQVAVLERARAFARAGGAVFAVLHDLNLTAEFADVVLVMQEGRIALTAAPSPAVFERIIAEVFELAGAASRLPAEGVAYVLPQSRFSRRSAQAG